MRSFRSASIGSISAWFPSRRSTLHHTGGRVMTCDGHVRSGKAMGAKGRYFTEASIMVVPWRLPRARDGATSRAA